MAKVGLITLHGMGNTAPDYAQDFVAQVREGLNEDQLSKLMIQNVYYETAIKDNQQNYLDKAMGDLRWKSMRRSIIGGLGDAAAVDAMSGKETSIYYQTQDKILDAFRALHRGLGPDATVFVVAYSLGGQVISSYLWDAAKQSGDVGVGVWSRNQDFSNQDEESFCRGNSVKRLYTIGCNIPVFLAGRGEDFIVPIKKPTDEFQWHNYYDKDDALGWPLQPLCSRYDRLVRDHPINAGFFSSWTPFSHRKYWTDGSFIRPVVSDLRQLIG